MQDLSFQLDEWRRSTPASRAIGLGFVVCGLGIPLGNT